MLSVALAAGAAHAAEPVLSLSDAVAIALAGNHELKSAGARADAAEARLTTARGARVPHLALEETVSRTTSPALVFTNLLGQEEFTQDNFEIESLNEPDALTNFNTALVVEQPLWAGGRIRGSIDAARLEDESAASRRERTRQEVVGQVIAAYAGAVAAERELETATLSLETARANVTLVSDLHQSGLVVESDLLQARVRESEVEETLARAESGVAVGRATLNLVLGRELDTPFALPTELEAARVPPEPLESLLAEARASRPDLDAAAADLAAAATRTHTARGERYPVVGLQGRYESNSEQGFDDAGTNWSVFLGARFPLYDGRTTASRVAEATAGEAEARAQQERLAASAELEVRRAYHELGAAQARVEQATRAVKLAEGSLRIVRDRYQEGLATWLELKEAETVLTGSRSRVIGASRDSLVAAAALDLALGRL